MSSLNWRQTTLVWNLSQAASKHRYLGILSQVQQRFQITINEQSDSNTISREAVWHGQEGCTFPGKRLIPWICFKGMRQHTCTVSQTLSATMFIICSWKTADELQTREISNFWEQPASNLKKVNQNFLVHYLKMQQESLRLLPILNLKISSQCSNVTPVSEKPQYSSPPWCHVWIMEIYHRKLGKCCVFQESSSINVTNLTPFILHLFTTIQLLCRIALYQAPKGSVSEVKAV